MLGTPPAFVLSQDQTLKFKSSTVLSHSFALFISLRPLSRTGIAWLVFMSLDLSVKQPQFFSSIQFSRSSPPRRLPATATACLVYLPFPPLSICFFSFFKTFFPAYRLSHLYPPPRSPLGASVNYYIHPLPLLQGGILLLFVCQFLVAPPVNIPLLFPFKTVPYNNHMVPYMSW